MEGRFSIDALEADLGLPAKLRVIANCGGQSRYIPAPENAHASKLAQELGLEIACWLAARFSGSHVDFPSRLATSFEATASELRAQVLEAGLTDPSKSANDIAKLTGHSARRVRQVREELRREARRKPTPLPLFERGGNPS